jgi:hypothetical protein
MRSDVGLDEYKRIRLTRREQEAADQARKDEENKHVFNAVAVLEEIFKNHDFTAHREKIQ